MRRPWNLLWLGLLSVVFLGAWAVHALRASLPPADEARRLPAGTAAGRGAAVEIEYDAAGVPTVKAEDESGLAFGQGWAQARDRRFQMELYRRTAQGRLAEWFGGAALPYDRHFRPFAFEAVAESAVARMDAPGRALLASYAAGINAYDAAHPAPPEWTLLGGRPEPWRAEDAVLVLAVMFDDLTWDEADEEARTERMDAALPPAVVAKAEAKLKSLKAGGKPLLYGK